MRSGGSVSKSSRRQVAQCVAGLPVQTVAEVECPNRLDEVSFHSVQTIAAVGCPPSRRWIVQTLMESAQRRQGVQYVVQVGVQCVAQVVVESVAQVACPKQHELQNSIWWIFPCTPPVGPVSAQNRELIPQMQELASSSPTPLTGQTGGTTVVSLVITGYYHRIQ